MAETEAKVALVVGGGRGMGGAIARQLHADGYRLALLSPSDSCETLAAELGGIAWRGKAEAATDLDALVSTAMSAYGRIDAVVVLAGHPPKGDLLDIADEAWTEGSDMMVLPLVRLAKRVTPIMLAQGGGAFLAVTTFAAYEPSLDFPVSCAYRAAAGAFAKMYADRYASDNIRFNCLLPGYIDSLNHKPGTADKVPMRRLGRVEEIAKTAAFLLSDGAGYITGQNLRVDGGVTRHV